MSTTQTQGTIVQCIGAVTDIEFPRDAMPGIYDALVLEDTAEGMRPSSAETSVPASV